METLFSISLAVRIGWNQMKMDQGIHFHLISHIGQCGSDRISAQLTDLSSVCSVELNELSCPNGHAISDRCLRSQTHHLVILAGESLAYYKYGVSTYVPKNSACKNLGLSIVCVVRWKVGVIVH